MSSLDMNILRPAKCFKRYTSNRSLVNETVNDFMYRLSSVIEDASKNGKCFVEAKLPSSFVIPDIISESDFRLEVYYNIVMMLENKGYKFRIKLDPANVNNIIVVSWEVEAPRDKSKWKTKLSEASYA